MRFRFQLNKKTILFLCLVFSIVCTVVAIRLDYNESRPYFLSVTMKAETSGYAVTQVYYDIGKGYNEDYSSKLNIVPAATYKYLFNFPGSKNIKSFRFDPLTKSGKVELKDIQIVTNKGTILSTIPVCELNPKQQIADFKISSNICTFNIPKDATDPVIIINNSSFSKFDGVVLYLLSIWKSIMIIFVSSLIASLIFSVLVRLIRPYFNSHATIIIFSLVCITFATLVGFGITGSSLQVLINYSPLIEAKMDRIALYPQPIRSDEYVAATPWIIAQANHIPPFPVINTNIGLTGQNMLVTGASDVPVKHLSSISKVAAWGFFFLDLKRALSWWWFVRVFSGLLALWWLMNIISPSQSLLNFSLSFLFMTSAFVTVWSLGPADFVFYGAMSLSLTVFILKQKSNIYSPLFGFILGVTMSGFALVLYPPWQIQLAYLFAFLFIGILIRDKLYKKINIIKIITIVIAMLTTSIVLYTWYLDSKIAIDILTNTSYPGTRFDRGGGFTIPLLLKGFTNITSIYSTNISNPSEIGSFYYMFLPLLAVAIFILRKTSREIYCTLIPLSLFMLLCLYYMFFQIPSFIAKYSLLYMAPGMRADFPLGIAYFIMCGVVLSKKGIRVFNNKLVIIISGLISVIWAYIVFYEVSFLHVGSLDVFNKSIMLLAVLLSGYFLITRNAKYFVIVTLLLTLYTTMWFNPISIAPDKFEAKRNIINIISKTGNNTQPYNRVLSLSTNSYSLYAAGIPTICGIMMYPQLDFWKRLDPNEEYLNIYNRFQNLNFMISNTLENKSFIISSPYPDTVLVMINPLNFDFSLTGAEIIIASQSQYELLKNNTSIIFLKVEDDNYFFRVTSKNDTKLK